MDVDLFSNLLISNTTAHTMVIKFYVFIFHMIKCIWWVHNIHIFHMIGKCIMPIFKYDFLYFSAMSGILCLDVQVNEILGQKKKIRAIGGKRVEKQHSREKHSSNSSMFKVCRLHEIGKWSARPLHSSIVPCTAVVYGAQACSKPCRSLEMLFSQRFESWKSLVKCTRQKSLKAWPCIIC